MGSGQGVFRVALVGLCFLAAGFKVSGGAAAQTGTQTGGSRQQAPAAGPGFGGSAAGDALRTRMQEKQIASAAEERHKRMVADTEKLLALATELKEEVGESNKNEMSIAAIKKAAELEKLARDVKERMKGD